MAKKLSKKARQSIDEKKLTKGQLRKLTALRKSLGEQIANKAFADWLATEKKEPKVSVDKNAERIVEALEPLVLANKIKLPRGGYLVRRGRGRVIAERAGGWPDLQFLVLGRPIQGAYWLDTGVAGVTDVGGGECPLLGVKRTFQLGRPMSAFSHKQTENGGDKVVHGSGGILACRGRSKTLPPVTFEPFGVGRWKDVHRGALFTRTIGLSC